MKYRLEILNPAQKDMNGLPKNMTRRVNQAIKSLAQSPYQRGSYRVIYDVDDSSRTVTVLRVRHRREAYR